MVLVANRHHMKDSFSPSRHILRTKIFCVNLEILKFLLLPILNFYQTKQIFGSPSMFPQWNWHSIQILLQQGCLCLSFESINIFLQHFTVTHSRLCPLLCGHKTDLKMMITQRPRGEEGMRRFVFGTIFIAVDTIWATLQLNVGKTNEIVIDCVWLYKYLKLLCDPSLSW